MKKLLIVLVLLLSPALFAADKVEKRTIEIYMQKKNFDDNTIGFYMWVNDADFIIRNSAPNVDVGYSFSGGIYLESDRLRTAMFFIHNWNEKSSNYCTVIEFGGIRPDDIHIYLPEGATAKVYASSLDRIYKKKE
jgi:hypothetical protein